MPLTIPNLDDKTFNELFEEARALIPRYAPEWTDHNLSDPGITFIDLFAWLAEMQIYYLNRVTDKNFLKFLKLLGEMTRPAKSARADLTFMLQNNNSSTTIPKGTQIAATDPQTAERIIFETDENILVHSSTLRQVLTYSGGRWIDNTTANETLGVSYFAFGVEPAQGDKLHLGFKAEQAFPTGEVSLVVNVFDADLSSTQGSGLTDSRPKIVPSAELEWHYLSSGNSWKQLQLDDYTAALTRNGSLRFKGPEDIAKAVFGKDGKDVRSVSPKELYWIRASVKKPGYEIPPRVDTIDVNTVSATHGQIFRKEYSASNGLPFQQIKLKNRPVLSGTVKLKIKEENKGSHRWTEVNDFGNSGPEDRHFIVDSQKGLLKFGDGIQGRIPPVVANKNGNIRVVRYRVGGGEKGNVKAEKINEIIEKNIKEKVLVQNRRPASGGVEPEPLAEAKSRVRRDFKQVTRGITTDDFETLTLKTPGMRIARVKVLPQYHPTFPAIQMPGSVTVVVVPEILPGNTRRLPEPSRGFLQNVYRHLKSRSLISTNLSVIGPDFIEVKVTAKIRIDPRMGAETVRVQALEALRKFLDPLTGGDDGKGWPFGRTVYGSEIFSVIEGVAGVICVDQVSLSGKSCDSSLRDRITLRKTGLVYSGEHEIAIC